MGQMAFGKKFAQRCTQWVGARLARIGFMLEWMPRGHMGQWARWPLERNFIQRCTECIRDRWGQDRFYVGVDTRGPDEPMGQMAFEKKSTQKCTEWFLGQSLSCVCKRKKKQKIKKKVA